MTTSPTPAPAQPDQPPQNAPSPGKTWTSAQLAARIQGTAPATTELLPATPAPAPPDPAGKPARPARKPAQRRTAVQPASPFPYVVVAINPQLRERHPEWPLSLEEALNLGKPPADPNPTHKCRAQWAEIPADNHASAQARAIVRDTLTAWGLPGLASDAEQFASEAAATAAGRSPGYPLGLTLDEHKPPGQPRWIYCAVTSYSPWPDTAPQPGQPPSCGPAAGAAIVTASGRDTTPDCTTTWFTLTSPHPAAARTNPERNPELEAGA